MSICEPIMSKMVSDTKTFWASKLCPDWTYATKVAVITCYQEYDSELMLIIIQRLLTIYLTFASVFRYIINQQF